MNRSGKLATLAVAVFLVLPTLAACGDDDEPSASTAPGTTGSSTGASGTPDTGDSTSGNATSRPGYGPKEPESAGDRRPDAPDQAISERPGGGGGGASPTP